MAEDTTPGPSDAQRKVVKDLVKEAMTEWVADQQKTRTGAGETKRPSGLFGAISELFE